MKNYYSYFLLVPLTVLLASFDSLAMYDSVVEKHDQARWLHQFAKALHDRDEGSMRFFAPQIAKMHCHGGAALNQPKDCETALKNNADIDEYVSGFTPLSLAAFLGHPDALNFLLKAKADVELSGGQFNLSGYTALHWAAVAGHMSCVVPLVEIGANLEAINNQGKTPLLLAAQNGHAQIVDFLASKNANLEHQSDDGDTALALAAQRNHIDVAVILRTRGARRNALNNQSMTPYDLAKFHGHEEMAKQLSGPVFQGSPRIPGSPPPLVIPGLLPLEMLAEAFELSPLMPETPKSDTHLRRARSLNSGETPPLRTPSSAKSGVPFNWPLQTVTE